MTTAKINRDLHRLIVQILMEGVPRTIGELESLTGYSRRVIKRHMDDSMNVVKKTRMQKGGDGRPRQFETYTLPYAVLKMRQPPARNRNSVDSQNSHPDIMGEQS